MSFGLGGSFSRPPATFPSYLVLVICGSGLVISLWSEGWVLLVDGDFCLVED